MRLADIMFTEVKTIGPGATLGEARTLMETSGIHHLVVVEGGPHGITWTHAEKVNTELVNFLRQPVPAVAV